MAYNFKTESTWALAIWYAQYGRAAQAGFYPTIKRLRLKAERELQARGIRLDLDSLQEAAMGEK